MGANVLNGWLKDFMIKMVEVEGSVFPEDLYYHRDHMWAKVEDGKVRVGYNDWAQKAAGNIVFVRVRRVGAKVVQGKTLGTIESGKWVGPLKAPVSGTIVEVNQEVLDKPSLINEDPYGRGWIAVIEPKDLENELKSLIPGTDAEAVKEWIVEEKKRHGL